MEALERAAGLLDEGEVLALGDVLRALEHHVLEEMGEAGAAGLLVLAADVVPQVDGHDRRAIVVGKEHAQAVIEPMSLDRDVGQMQPPAG